ncbi:MAG: Bax inhibitor-1/YccA family protein [Bifidobacteriaceae bacterium]|jgi:uncharacterized YccA/Bax inhibitor family protein|nr:Bax inhibitor-1/YccA family protein [Bifidobacteriaceae bacterium]
MSNPAFTRSPAFNGRAPAPAQANPYAADTSTGYAAPTAQQLGAMYAAPSASPVDTGRLTYDDVLIKSVGMLAVMLFGAVIGWLITPQFPVVYVLCALAGLILTLVNVFKRSPSPILISSYAICQGVFVGGISQLFNSLWNGIVLQAVVGTFAVFGITLALFASGKVRASAKASRIVLIGLIAYLAYSVINVVLMYTGVTTSMFGLDSQVQILGIPLGALVGPFVILMGAYCLVASFDVIKVGVANGVPARYAWTAAFGLLVDVIFLYIQILRWLAILQRN